jgi:hypothetical protein
MPVYSQQRSRPASRRKANNATASVKKIPIIKSFKSSRPTAIIPCPWETPLPFCPKEGLLLQLATEASARNGDTLLYQYSVTGGRIQGEGATVEWDLTGMTQGFYRVKVIVKDKRGRVASSSLNVNVVPCSNCGLLPCIVVDVTCADEAKEGQSLICTVSVTGGDPDVKPTYKWTVSAGTIVKGQNTDKIEIDTTNLVGQQVEATVEVNGYPPECQNRASRNVRVGTKSDK